MFTNKDDKGLFEWLKVCVCVIAFSLLSACQIFTESRFYQYQSEWNVVNESSASFTNIQQPGDKLCKYLLANEDADTKNILLLLKSAGTNFKQLRTFSESNPDIVTELVTSIAALNDKTSRTPNQIANVLATLLESNSQQQSLYLSASMLLYPLYTYRISALVSDSNPKYEEAIKRFLVNHKHLPALIFPRQQHLAQTVRVTPLINSLSVTVYNQLPHIAPTVKVTNIETSKGKLIAMYYEPVQGAFSGSRFYLEADTKYRISVSIGSINIDEIEIRTRKNMPPLDDNNVYQLKDIYSGGQLNINKLGISGKKGAWATIDGSGITLQSKDLAAIDVGNSSYIYFRNITIGLSGRHGIVSDNAHHLWFDTCNISNWGREVKNIKGGLAFDSSKAKKAINYDAAFALKNTGVVVIENCEVHSPKSGANTWKFGHPMGPTAMLVSADHATDAYDGQYIVRNNRFYGSYHKRFNDVIESRNNGRVWGGFVRDSVVHNNYLAYANDDAIEIDGGANNVAVYENEILHTFVGVSAIPVMMGPAYVFRNTFSDMGDQEGKWFTQLKLGGVLARPVGVVVMEQISSNISQKTKSAGRFNGDKTYWFEVQPD